MGLKFKYKILSRATVKKNLEPALFTIPSDLLPFRIIKLNSLATRKSLITSSTYLSLFFYLRILYY